MLHPIVDTIKKVDKGQLVLKDREERDVVVYDCVRDLKDDLTNKLIRLLGKIIKTGDCIFLAMVSGSKDDMFFCLCWYKGKSNWGRSPEPIAYNIKEPDEVIVDEFEWGEEGCDIESPEFSFEVDAIKFVDIGS